MRSDTNLGFTKDFDRVESSARRVDERLLEQGASFSGHERNHLFINLRGSAFEDISGISGLDHPGDGRSFAWLDYDRDGWLDVATVNANAPMLQLFRNKLGDNAVSRHNNFVALRLIGGNQDSASSSEWSNRDGYGAIVDIVLQDTTLRREHRAGEGMAAQNSATLLVGIGRATTAGLRVRWPSGRSQGATDTQMPVVSAGSLITIYEDPSQSPTGDAFVVETYASTPPEPAIDAAIARRALSLTLPGDDPGSELYLYTTFATWCAPCLAELPELRQLDAALPGGTLTMYGVPYDRDEETALIEAWVEANEPPYRMLLELPEGEAADVAQAAIDILGIDAVPLAIVTDATGRILLVRFGPPTLSEIRELLSKSP